MATKKIHSTGRQTEQNTTPFSSTEEAWFWFVQAQLAKESGARIKMGQSPMPRPCEPIDVLRVLDRLYRQRRLLIDHIHVLKHYGLRQMAPDPERIKEVRASVLWQEAMLRMAPVLIRKGIVKETFHRFMEAAE